MKTDYTHRGTPMKKLALLFILLFIGVSAVSAFEVYLVSDESIYANETASFPIQIENTGSIAERVELVFELDPKWSFETSPLTHLSPFLVPPESIIEFAIIIDPISDRQVSGKYSIPFTVRSLVDDGQTAQEEMHEVELTIKNPEALTGYLPSLNFVLDAQEQVDPRHPTRVKLEVINRNPLNIVGMDVAFESTFYAESKTADLAPLGSTTIVFDVPYEAQQQPMRDTYKVTVTVGDKVFDPIKKNVEIIGYSDVSEETIDEGSFFFKYTEKTQYLNTGNALVNKEIKYPTTRFKQLFTSTVPAGHVVEDRGLLYYTTTVPLPVNQPIVVTHVVNYRYALWALFALLCLIGLYYLLRSPVVVSKETITVRVDKEGKMKIKVLIHVKNRSMKIVEDISVKDRIPAVAEIQKHFEVGTMKPQKILKNNHAGTLLKWHIHHLEAYEERIITYKVHSKYQIVGDFRLPATEVRYKNKKGVHVKQVSNKPKVGKKPR